MIRLTSYPNPPGAIILQVRLTFKLPHDWFAYIIFHLSIFQLNGDSSHSVLCAKLSLTWNSFELFEIGQFMSASTCHQYSHSPLFLVDIKVFESISHMCPWYSWIINRFCCLFEARSLKSCCSNIIKDTVHRCWFVCLYSLLICWTS